jgi:hypothetical protein
MIFGKGSTILYADDQILMAASEDDLQTMAIWRNHKQRVKIVINDNIIEQVTDFKNLG